MGGNMEELSETARIIMGVFREYRVVENQSLAASALLEKRELWTPEHRNNFLRGIVELINEGYMLWDEREKLVLTEAGFRVISGAS